MRVPITLLLLLLSSCFISAQDQSFDSFISRLSKEFNVDVAIAPELIPVLDSIKNHGNGIDDIQELLETILRDKYVSYQIIDGNKVLLRSEYDAGAEAEQKLITGTILDKHTRAPLPFAAVSIPNTTRGTYTDELGNFRLYIDKNADALQISYLGYESKVIPIDDFNG